MELNIPTQSGYYWRRTPDVEEIVKVDIITLVDPHSYFYWVPGDMGGIFIKAEPNVTWFGPLPTMDGEIQIHKEIFGLADLLNKHNVPFEGSLVDAIDKILREAT